MIHAGGSMLQMFIDFAAVCGAASAATGKALQKKDFFEPGKIVFFCLRGNASFY